MKGATPGFDALGEGVQFGIVLQAVVADGVANAHQLLANDATRPDREVTNLRISHLVCRQTDVGSAGFNQCVRIGMPKRIHDRSICSADGVVVGFIPVAPTIQNRQDDRSYSCGSY